jgi:hypothetical protein
MGQLPETSVVVAMTWRTKYINTRAEFLSWFTTEQEYVDAEFTAIIAYNYGVYWTHRERGYPVPARG